MLIVMYLTEPWEGKSGMELGKGEEGRRGRGELVKRCMRALTFFSENFQKDICNFIFCYV